MFPELSGFALLRPLLDRLARDHDATAVRRSERDLSSSPPLPNR
jgi:hypothetical protein